MCRDGMVHEGKKEVKAETHIKVPDLCEHVKKVLQQPVVQDELDENGASCELLSTLAQRHEVLFQRPSPDSSTTAERRDIAPDVRGYFLWYLEHLLKLLHIESSWFQAVVIFDMYCLNTANEVDLRDLPSVLGALALLLKKVECAQFQLCESDGNGLLMCAMHLGQSIQQAAQVEPASVTKQSLEVQEVQILEAVRWRLNMPSFESWMSLYCSRLMVLSKQVLRVHITWLWEQGFSLARHLMLQRPTSSTFTPRQLAQGMLCIGFEVAGLLPSGSLSMEDPKDPEVRNDVKRLLQPPSSEALTPAQQRTSFALLQVCTGSTPEALQKDCDMVRDELRKSGLLETMRSSVSQPHSD